MVLFGDSLEWFEPEEAAKFAAAGFAEGRHRARSSGMIKFASQGPQDVKVKRTGDKNFEVSVASKNPREFELLTKPTDFEMSDSLKLLLQGAFFKTHAVDAKRCGNGRSATPISKMSPGTGMQRCSVTRI